MSFTSKTLSPGTPFDIFNPRLIIHSRPEEAFLPASTITGNSITSIKGESPLTWTPRQGREIIYKLIEQADVFISNLRPYELEKFKLEYDTLKKINPRLIFASLTGYGLTGPDRNSPGYDIISYWSRAAIPYLLDALGFRPAIGDNLGGLMLAFGIMSALFVRERTGIGQAVDTSLFKLGVFQMSFDISGALVEKKEFTEFKPKGREDSMNPLVGMYPTKDGRAFVLMCLLPDLYWPKVCRALGREDLIHDPRFHTFEARAENRMELFKIFDERFMSKTMAEWKPIFAEIPSAPIQNLLEVINDPHARANDYFVTLDHPNYGPMEVIAPPVKFSETPATVQNGRSGIQSAHRRSPAGTRLHLGGYSKIFRGKDYFLIDLI